MINAWNRTRRVMGAPSFNEYTWITLPKGGYPYGVEARGKGENAPVELHGAFTSFDEAESYRAAMEAEFDDYAYMKVVKIETPEATS